MPLPTFNLIGPGRLGRTLARLWHDAGLLAVARLVGRDAHGIAAARDFIGAGSPATLDALEPADFTLIATPDDALAATAAALAAGGAVRPGDVVFHCSGALPSEALAPVRAAGGLVASVHPLKSFADPARAIADFAGTRCGCEGDAAALARLAPLFDAIGAQRFALDPAGKTLYHAAAVLACNDLVALMDAALRCMAAAGVPRETAWPALRPLIDGTLANLDRLAPAEALTGPVARGDAATVARQLAATTVLDPAVGEAYRALGALALRLAAPTLPEGRADAVAQALGAAP
ncbi:Rossmann-like and DUF2520 domain-containing protein [Chitinimonas koreensis]|uniref:Rossmann-like and DUF2520 domain-containing protein n=1 Tax=Chitinimonas koreensis TaxID=356302 RepID=UPI0004043B5F|nr:Rossmann-like and DUF2520 domain-containing protein [Chitinimonas koreensis]QNM95855.1 DUF2520 domain-containing protein [Chitinimonas koreensis]